jgi:hypothetical protein
VIVGEARDEAGDLAQPLTGWRARLGGLGLFALLHKMEKAQRDTAVPQVVASDDRSEALAQHATRLAEEGRSDIEAVDELRREAGRHRRALHRAAALVRFQGSYQEDRVADRANRLLLAAANGTAVQPVGADEEAWFARIEAFGRLPVQNAFALLVAVQPALATFEADIRRRCEAGRERDGTLAADEEDDVLRDVWDGVAVLVGPWAEATDRLLRSWAAFGVARVHILLAAGLIDHLEEE